LLFLQQLRRKEKTPKSDNTMSRTAATPELKKIDKPDVLRFMEASLVVWLETI